MENNLISDIHLNFKDLVLPGGRLLIVAGDSLEVGHLRRADNAGQDKIIAERYRRFINEEFAKYDSVIFIMGNHEHYHNEYSDTIERLKKEMPANVHFLEKESVEIDGVWYFGGTFWTDMNRGDPMTIDAVARGMNDFHVIKNKHILPNGSYTSKFTPEQAMAIFHETVQALGKFLDDHKNDKVVVISHHAPSPLSVNEEFKSKFHLNGGYHSHLTEFILDHPQIVVWVHGHMHDPVDYMIGTTRVISNPRGYAGYEIRANEFNPGFSFEV
jgi:Icc-related predicted phosphoesterase